MFAWIALLLQEAHWFSFIFAILIAINFPIFFELISKFGKYLFFARILVQKVNEEEGNSSKANDR